MRVLIYISIILIFILGALTSYSDIKYKRAFNRQLIIFLLLGICIQLCSFILEPSVWRVATVNCVLTIVVSILFYVLGIWAAGDSKLFITMIFLVPYSLYMTGKKVFFPAFFILEFAFTLAVIYIFVESIILFCAECKEKIFSQIKMHLPAFSKETVISWLSVFLLVDTCDVLLYAYGSSVLTENNYLLIAVNVLLVSVVLSALSKIIIKIGITCVLLVIRIAFSLKLGLVFSRITVWTIFIVTVLAIMRKFTTQYNYRTISVSKLEPGNVLAKSSLIFMIPSAVKGLPKFTDETTHCRLTEDEVEAVKRWEKSRYGQSTVTIVRTIPFAPFIFGGVMLYLVYMMFLGV